VIRPILAFAVTLGSVLLAQEPTAPQHPKVSLLLPFGFDSETVQIDYFMTGPFGGFGGSGMWVKTDKDKTAYEIDASVEGRAAKNVKVIAWLTGCEIVTLNIPIENEKAERKLSCKSLSSIDIKGQVFPIEMINGATEIDVRSLGFWSHQFFGISDGPVVQFQIGKVTPDVGGAFEIKLPDLASQEGMSNGEFQFILREKNTGNILAFLKPMEDSGQTHNQKVAHEYPNVVRFAAARR